MDDTSPILGRTVNAINLANLVWDSDLGNIDDVACVLSYFYESIMGGTSQEVSLQAAESYLQLRLEERAKPKEPKKKARKVTS